MITIYDSRENFGNSKHLNWQICVRKCYYHVGTGGSSLTIAGDYHTEYSAVVNLQLIYIQCRKFK